MRAQTEAALIDCDAILFVVDARAGLTAADQHFAQAVRRAGKPIIVIANKAESTAGKAGVYEVFGLGLGEPIAFSAEHGEGLSELYDALVEVLPAAARLDPDEESEAEPLVLGEEEDGSELDLAKPLRIAVLGRPNAGKSTLINHILGQDRLLVGPEPGITRDSIGLDAEWNGRKLKIFDTAGLRRKSRIVEKVEKLAVADALRAVRFAEVVVLLLDATIPFERQDLTLADLVEKEGRALVIGLNKWDLVDNKSDKARGVARGSRPAPAAAARNARDPPFRPDWRACRPAHGSDHGDGRDLEHPHLHRPAQSLARARHRRHAAARRLRAPRQDPLHDPAQGAPAVSSCCSAIRSTRFPRATSAISSTACARPSASSACRSGCRCAPGSKNPYAPKKRWG